MIKQRVEKYESTFNSNSAVAFAAKIFQDIKTDLASGLILTFASRLYQPRKRMLESTKPQDKYMILVEFLNLTCRSS
jgi:hypothetical protein